MLLFCLSQPQMSKLPSGQINQMYFGNRFAGHSLDKAGLRKSYRKDRMTPTARIVHICTGRGSQHISLIYKFLCEEKEKHEKEENCV